jgi:hypothetical protein
MILKQEFENVEIMFENQTGKLKYDELCEAPNECVKIAENFAIKFALWKETIVQDDNGLYYNESRAQISRKNPVDIKGLLEAFKRQQ